MGANPYQRRQMMSGLDAEWKLLQLHKTVAQSCSFNRRRWRL